ncbi:Nucleotidyl transferase AbiEii toxin, Type IV TA system [Pedobacter steynii]|uniref:Nucleotidyl transferase AbiEii toxin, Type IV TA system n=1 Tax=Pedobacter steynii TaxID=430522 RepID=A0A1G9SJZ3_9SPHI|nr:nucleotidyl transferase AbiEii/AbiGii toxin family protein [Pedobacter steynii]NQX37392.1 nucleotidyl transferase AbiEii/AbiGii toxin family protein [Pedobacter steynii]SDM35739.1 Nucleotidyl transferase AbiEii toxin, Type IV TA system [Pedobacter steynii]
MLYWNTVNNELRNILLKLMQANEFREFRLVGGTALSLHLGHRISVDIDLFTDATYRSIDFDAIDHYLRNSFEYVVGDFGGNPGMGKSYLIGSSSDQAIKLDVYYSMDPFFQDEMEYDGIRLATVEEIIAMKVDVIQRGGRKKDFWDLHELLPRYDVKTMIDLHRQRFEWTHDPKLILKNFVDFQAADQDFDPICLLDKEWIFIKEDIEIAVDSVNI